MRGLARFTILVIVLMIIVSGLLGYSLLTYRKIGYNEIRIATLHGGISSIDIVKYLHLDMKYGLKIDLIYFEKTLDISNALLKNEVDIAIIPIEIAAKTIELGGKIYIIAADTYQNQKLIVRKEIKINNINMLKKIKIGVFTPTGTYAMFKAYMKRIYGFSDKDFNLVNLPPDLMVQSILNGNVDMIVIWEPLASRAISAGCKVFMTYEDLWKKATNSSRKPIMIVYVATKKFVEYKRDLIEKFLEMRSEAVKIWDNNYNIAKNILMKYYELDENSSKILYNNLEFYPYKEILYEDYQVIKSIVKLAYEGGYLKTDISNEVINSIYH